MSLGIALKHITLEIYGDVATNSTGFIAAAIDIASYVCSILFSRTELVLDIELDERII